MEKVSNYEIMRQNAGRAFLSFDHGKIAEKLGLKYQDGRLYIKLFDRDYTVDCSTGAVLYNGSDAGYDEAMVVYDILCDSKENARTAGEYTLLHQLSQVQSAKQYYAGQGMFLPYEKKFDKRVGELENICLGMGGEKYGKGDMSVRIPMFRDRRDAEHTEDLSIVISFWESDEDFPAQLQLFTDKNLLQYIHYETAWYMFSYLLTRIAASFDNDVSLL